MAAYITNPGVCATCGEKFRPNVTDAKKGFSKYCSRACYGVSRRLKPKQLERATRMAWYYHHGWQEFSAEYRCGKACERCGSKRRLSVHHREDPLIDRRVDLLFDEANLELLCQACHVREHHLNRTTSKCEHCGEDFEHTKSKNPKYCSQTCYDAVRAIKKRTCIECGTTFMPVRPETQRCSQACGTVATAAKKRSRRIIFTCPICGETFSVPPSQAKRGVAAPCCSKSCRFALRKREVVATP